MSRPLRVLEFLLLNVAVPLLLYAVLPIRYLLPIVWCITLYCYSTERMHQSIRTIWAREAVNWKTLKPILLRFVVAATLLTLVVWQCKPELLFNFVRTRPAFWALIMLLYPVLSVIPQEIIFRSFFFMRYRTFFTDPRLMIVASAVAFGFAHILFHNWVAPILCLVGGLMFAHTYHKRRSLLLVVIEHALYGDLIFTIGLGRYFYHGSIAAALS